MQWRSEHPQLIGPTRRVLFVVFWENEKFVDYKVIINYSLTISMINASHHATQMEDCSC